MTTQVRVFDRFGVPLSDLECDVRRSWEYQRAGSAVLRIAKSDPKCTEVNLRFGNLIMIEHEDAGRWGGVIDLPRRWGRDEIVVTAYTPEFLLKYSSWATNGYTDQTAGYRIENNMYNYFEGSDKKSGFIFELGTIYDGGIKWDDDITQHYLNCLEMLEEYAANTGQEWEFKPMLRANGKMYFELNWYETLGQTHGDVVLEEGKHILVSKEDLLIEQGEIVNDIESYWLDGLYYSYGAAGDAASQNFYGTRYKYYDIDYINADIEEAGTAAKLAKLKEPQRSFNLRVVNEEDVFKFLGIGDIVSVRLINYGFTDNSFGLETDVRIMSKEFSEADGFMTLGVEEDV